MTTPVGVDASAVPKGTEMRIDLALDGVENVLTSTSTLEVGGMVMTQSAIEARLQKSAQLQDAPRLLRAQLLAAVAAKKADESDIKSFLTDLKAGAVARYGRSNVVLLQFGFKPYKAPAKRTTAKNAVSTANALATRSARGTKGSRQKAAIKGEGNPVIVTGTDGAPKIAVAPSGPTGTPSGSSKT